MVDGFIQKQEGAALGHQQGQFQAGALTVAHLSARAQGIVTGEQEEVQEVTGFGLGEDAGGLDGFQRTFAQVEVFLFLGHVAEPGGGTQPDGTGKRRQFAGDGAQQGGLPAAVRTGEGDTLTGAQL